MEFLKACCLSGKRFEMRRAIRLDEVTPQTIEDDDNSSLHGSPMHYRVSDWAF
jgi:hypothetical protein